MGDFGRASFPDTNESNSDERDSVSSDLYRGRKNIEVFGPITPEFDCGLACMLLAEEEAETVAESEKLFRRALRFGGFIF